MNADKQMMCYACYIVHCASCIEKPSLTENFHVQSPRNFGLQFAREFTTSSYLDCEFVTFVWLAVVALLEQESLNEVTDRIELEAQRAEGMAAALNVELPCSTGMQGIGKFVHTCSSCAPRGNSPHICLRWSMDLIGMFFPSVLSEKYSKLFRMHIHTCMCYSINEGLEPRSPMKSVYSCLRRLVHKPD